MPSPKAKPETHLPKQRPKKTGRRGIGPVEKEPQRQGDLPGMEDREIAEIERAAERYAGIRDRRIALNAEEHQLKLDLLGLMKQHKRETYVHDGIEVRVVHEKENVKVKLHKEEED